MCEYCNPNREEPSVLTYNRTDFGILGNAETGIIIDTYKKCGRIAVVLDRGKFANYELTSKQIFYCPMCGRKLTEMED